METSLNDLTALADGLLVTKSLQGDQDAFRVLMERHQGHLYHLLLSVVHHREDAWDLLQETFLKAYASLAKLKKPQAFAGWLLKIGVNLAINYLKRNQRLKKVQQSHGFRQTQTAVRLPEDILWQKELGQKLAERIEKLPVKQKVALLLCDVEGFSYKKIAQLMDCSIGTVMSRIFHARKRLRQELGAYIRVEA